MKTQHTPDTTPQEMTNDYLLTLTIEIAGRLALYGTKEMHDRLSELRPELSRRLQPIPQRRVTIGSSTGTVFVDGEPTGIEIKVFNERGMTREELIARLNTSPAEHARLKANNAALLEACEDALSSSVDAGTYPDGPCLPKEVRNALKAAATP